jgi:hypothetical protein
LDGNAIAGTLLDVFSGEMTTARGVCASCHAGAQLGELAVYMSAVGIVGRCRSCGARLLVVVAVRGIACVDLLGFASLELPPGEERSPRGR